MGGLGGHIMHPYEDLSLSIGGIKAMMQRVSSGCVPLFEKTDGQNMFVRWVGGSQPLRVARNKGDLLVGGVSIQTLSERYEDKPIVLETFSTGAHVIENMFKNRSIPKMDDVWFSVELMSKRNPNVVNYSGNFVVFHQFGPSTFSCGQLEPVTEMCREDLFTKLFKKEKFVTLSFRDDRWAACRSPTVRVVVPKGFVGPFISKLDQVSGCRDHLTVGDLFVEHVIASVPNVVGSRSLEIAKYVVNVPDALGWNELAKGYSLIKRSQLRDHINTLKRIESCVRKLIEDIVHEFSVALLEHVVSAFIENQQNEVLRIKAAVKSMLQEIDASCNEQARAFAASHRARLGDIDKISSAIEGVVFDYNDTVYKLTGSFAPINQILGIKKYGRVDLAR